MKKSILTLILVAFVTLGYAENAAYILKMKEAIAEMETCASVADYKKVANTFDRISQIEKEEWLPLYYAANIHIIMTYIDSAASMQQKDKYLDEAEEYIKKLETLVPQEAEVQLIKAFMIITRIGLDSNTRGATMYASYEAALNKAQALNPENPRVQFMVLSNDVGKAKWFGQDTASFCPKMKKLYEAWDFYPQVSEIHPSWGKKELKDLMVGCS